MFLLRGIVIVVSVSTEKLINIISKGIYRDFYIKSYDFYFSKYPAQYTLNQKVPNAAGIFTTWGQGFSFTAP